MTRVLYTLVGIFITPLLHVWLRRRARRGKELQTRLAERFGHPSLPRPMGKLIWLHAASVGEAQSVLTLAQSLLLRQPSVQLLITTGTVTSAALIAAQALPRTQHQFIPVDTAFAVRRFLAHWRPDLVLWVESEFWPQLLWQIQDRAIPALLINARISESTAKNWQRTPRSIASLLATFSAIYAGSSGDAERLRSLGAKNVRDAGNLKYDADPLPCDDAQLAILRDEISARPAWLAASTHANEEEHVAMIHAALVQQFPDLLTIIVPRHAVRGDEIAAMIRSHNIVLSQRSKNEAIASDTGIYLADTMGELGLFFRLSPVVFLGGSLIPHGGHNPLEPARLGCAVITGPHTHNFDEIMQKMLQAHVIHVAANSDALAPQISVLLSDAAQRETLGERARAFVEKSSGASEIILQQIDAIVGRE
jgi:3-deoxy-D-manno-octulosonic-acid transferase